ncbi:hypothetical protein P9436_10855 [Lysinibacillus capsici]|uniref:hypothetical protein n=1 Tax=Lysinibacillus capsici TaxID=2115968 RepID=UPI002E1DB04B|nr:hypothetical protein [Lysinibacillus capsici]
MVRVQRQQLREKLQKPYDIFEHTYNFNIMPMFDKLSEETEDYIDYLAEDLMREEGITSLSSDLQKYVVEEGITRQNMYLLMQYNMRLMWISTMYQFWEQQVRKFLFDESIQSGYTQFDENGTGISFEKYCINFGQIKDEFTSFGQNLEELNCWSTINELKFLANVIKHGEGRASTNLEKIRPDFFKSEITDSNLMKLHRTVLNEQVLNIKDSDLVKYKVALQNFWEELPDRPYCEIQGI